MLTQPLLKNKKICLVCGKEFHRTGTNPNRGKYCSVKCKGISQKGITKQGRPKNGIYKICQKCQKRLYVPKCQSQRKKYCSMECRNSDKEFWNNVRGENAYNWKGGKTKINGYIYITSSDHPFKNSGDYVAEHRLVMEKGLGRYLKPNEFIHHKNGVKDDNRIENLEILINWLHHGKMECPYCQKEFLIR